MSASFDALIDSYLAKNIGIAENFLSPVLSAHLKRNLLALYQHQKLQLAGTGQHASLQHDVQMRGDKIHWLDRANHDQHENDFFDLIDRFVLFLNATCFTGITGYEFHYTLYEKGSFYKKHLDQFRNNKSRAYSMVMYLNEDWQQEDGGELCIHHAGNVQHIAPRQGNSVFFKSDELEHEVLMTNKPRMSITGWLKVG